MTANLKAAPFPLAAPVVSALLNERPARQLTTLPVYRLEDISSMENGAQEAEPSARAAWRSWVDDYRPNAEPEPYNPVLVRIALSRRGEVFRRTGLPGTRNARATLRERLAADAHRASDPFEQAKMFLQRKCGPVFCAGMRGGPPSKWFVSGQPDYLSEAELIALAEKKGWTAK